MCAQARDDEEKREYSPASKSVPSGRFLVSSQSQNDKFVKIASCCKQFNNVNFNSAGLQEEQERELSPEIEAERQIQMPPPATPEKHYKMELGVCASWRDIVELPMQRRAINYMCVASLNAVPVHPIGKGARSEATALPDTRGPLSTVQRCYG